ncbi:LacI family transcriptional regulator [Nocardioides panacis]|uniref:LacI family transcriptional regulator n=1 Tax=Nocardioides panacis TaxID=2849501 RepID=A0A975Y1Y8_9ACTN|nr:LacI family DNA-binding transcriptional regulator [Nocardioides panacis]QWZ09904.1 LacI family transcriptional regulator [Nocardioides panacis]
MRVRLRDVAEHAGVSVKTVSNVVNGYVHVSPAMREKVQAALEELNYRANLSARSLRRGRSGLIALAVPALDMPYFAELTRFVVQEAELLGWTVLVDQTDGLREREQVVATGLRSHLIDGLILSPVAMDYAELSAVRDETPMVLLGEKIGGADIDHVAFDNVAAARVATEHLLSLGRTRVAAIGYQAGVVARSGVAEVRRTGYEQALAAAGLPVRASLTRTVAGFQRLEGARAMDSLLAERPDAVLCFNDQLALGALRALAVAGVPVPDEVAVIGIDDIEDGRFSSPTLSTIAPDKAAVAREAVRLLHHRLGGPAAPSREVSVGFELVARESTLGRRG